MYGAIIDIQCAYMIVEILSNVCTITEKVFFFSIKMHGKIVVVVFFQCSKASSSNVSLACGRTEIRHCPVPKLELYAEGYGSG